MTGRGLDSTDRAILRHIQEDARITHSELAGRVGLSTPGLQKRLRKLEEAGVIQRYVTQIDRRALGYDLLCYVQISLHRHEPEAVENFRVLVQSMPEVLECDHVTGEHDYLLKVAARNTADLERFLLETLTPVRGMDRIHTSLVLREIKTRANAPIDEEAE